jgi:hypothetical protein
MPPGWRAKRAGSAWTNAATLVACTHIIEPKCHFTSRLPWSIAARIHEAGAYVVVGTRSTASQIVGEDRDAVERPYQRGRTDSAFGTPLMHTRWVD